MDQNTLIEYYVSINSLRRMESLLEKLAVDIPKIITDSVKELELEKSFSNQKTKNNILSLDDFVEKELEEHEDDGYPDALYSYYLYALSNFLAFWIDFKVESLQDTQDAAIDFYIYKAAHDYMFKHGGETFIFSDEQNDEIETSECVLQEKRDQELDRHIAEGKYL